MVKRLAVVVLTITGIIFAPSSYTQSSKPYSIQAFLGLTAAQVNGQRQLSCGVVENLYVPNRDTAFGAVFGVDIDTSTSWLSQHYPGTTFGAGLAIFTDLETKGYVFQEGIFQNLAYQYQTQNTSLFAQVKKKVTLQHGRELLLLLGLGADWITSRSYSETPIDSSSIGKSNTFKSHTRLRPAIVLGIHAPVNHSVTVGYRIYAMGHGQLESNLSCCTNYNLKTTTNPVQVFIVSYRFN